MVIENLFPKFILFPLILACDESRVRYRKGLSADIGPISRIPYLISVSKSYLKVLIQKMMLLAIYKTLDHISISLSFWTV